MSPIGDIIKETQVTELSRGGQATGMVDMAAGTAGLTSADIELPRISLLQSNSQVVVDEKAKAGEFWNTLTSESMGTVIGFVPIMPFRNRVLLKMGEGLLCRSDTSLQIGVGTPGGECELCPMKDWQGKTPPPCGVSHNYLVLIVAKDGSVKDRSKGVFVEPKPCEPEMGVLQFRSTATSTAKKINGLYVQSQMKRPGAWWMTGFRLWSTPTRNDKGNFFIPEVSVSGPTPDDLIQQAINLAQFVAPSALTYVPTTSDGDPESAPF